MINDAINDGKTVAGGGMKKSKAVTTAVVEGYDAWIRSIKERIPERHCG